MLRVVGCTDDHCANAARQPRPQWPTREAHLRRPRVVACVRGASCAWSATLQRQDATRTARWRCIHAHAHCTGSLWAYRTSCEFANCLTSIASGLFFGSGWTCAGACGRAGGACTGGRWHGPAEGTTDHCIDERPQLRRVRVGHRRERACVDLVEDVIQLRQGQSLRSTPPGLHSAEQTAAHTMCSIGAR